MRHAVNGHRDIWKQAAFNADVIVRRLGTREVRPAQNEMDVRRVVFMTQRIVGVEPHEVNPAESAAVHFAIQLEIAQGLAQPEFQVQGGRPLNQREFTACVLACPPRRKRMFNAQNDAGPLQAGLDFDCGRSRPRDYRQIERHDSILQREGDTILFDDHRTDGAPAHIHTHAPDEGMVGGHLHMEVDLAGVLSVVRRVVGQSATWAVRWKVNLEGRSALPWIGFDEFDADHRQGGCLSGRRNRSQATCNQQTHCGLNARSEMKIRCKPHGSINNTSCSI